MPHSIEVHTLWDAVYPCTPDPVECVHRTGIKKYNANARVGDVADGGEKTDEFSYFIFHMTIYMVWAVAVLD